VHIHTTSLSLSLFLSRAHTLIPNLEINACSAVADVVEQFKKGVLLALIQGFIMVQARGVCVCKHAHMHMLAAAKDPFAIATALRALACTACFSADGMGLFSNLLGCACS
jgi:hypothetical protein